MRPFILFIIIILIAICASSVMAQVTDSIYKIKTDTSYKVIQFSKDSLEGEVLYKCEDSSMISVEDRVLYLWGGAEVKYLDYQINAPEIIVNFAKKEVYAKKVDAVGARRRIPVVFKDKEEYFESDSMKYNFETKKAIVYSTATKQTDLFIHGEKTKLITVKNDSGQVQNFIYNKNALITTCNKEVPHYGIRSLKQKVEPDKIAVIGVSYLEIEKVPTPVILPFGFFPLFKNKHHGLIIPRDYENSQQLGFGFRDVGYYFPISDRIQTTLLTDIYLRGSYKLGLNTEYKTRYKYNGRLLISYARQVTESAEVLTKIVQPSFSINWQHNQDEKANPMHKFSGSVNFQTNDFANRTNNSANAVVNNTFGSNINYSRIFRDKPFNLTVNASHNQVRATRRVEIQLPVIDFSINRFALIKPSKIGTRKWYHDIGMTYNAGFKNQYIGTDTFLFDSQSFKEMSSGFRQSSSINLNFPILKYLNVGLSANGSHVIEMKKVKYTLDPTWKYKVRDTIFNSDSTQIISIRQDTIFGKLDTLVSFSPVNVYDANASASISTNLYGTLQFKGKIKAIRHTLRPTFSFGYSPKMLNSAAYDSIYLSSAPNAKRTQVSNIYREQFSRGQVRTKNAFTVNYGFTNLFEAKYRGSRDTIDKKIKLLDNINVRGSYSIEADSFNWSPIYVSTNSLIFKKWTNVSFNAVFDPYGLDTNGFRNKELLWKKSRKLARFDNFSLTFNTNFSLKDIRNLFVKKGENPSSSVAIDGILDNFSIGHNIGFVLKNTGKKDTFYTNYHSINTAGDIKLSKRWSLNITNIGYDFLSKSLTYPDLGFNCDLHCWEMGMSWQPQRGTYTFYLRVKPSTFGFINIPYRKNQFDAYTGY